MRNFVQCPCCKHELYATHPMSAEMSRQVSGAKIESDGKGTHMVCQHCQARVEFERDDGRMVVAPEQPCDPGN